MKIKKNYVNIVALFALNAVINDCNAAENAGWWSRLMPSSETLTGMSWVAPAAVAAQRSLASESKKLPAYSYFIPGALGTALGTISNRNQSWGSALASSLFWQSPSLALAAALWAREKWAQKDINQSLEVAGKVKLNIFNQNLPELMSKYSHELSRFLTLLNKEIGQEVGPNYQSLIDLYDKLVLLRQQIIEQNTALMDQWKKGLLPVSWKTVEKQFNDLKKHTYLTPAQEVYANYIAYHMAQDDFFKNVLINDAPYALMDKKFFKEKIQEEIRARELITFVHQLQEQGFKIAGQAAENVEQFAKLLSLDEDILLKKIFTYIKKHMIAMSPVGSSADSESVFNIRVDLYAKDMNKFVDTILSNNPLPSWLDASYIQISKLYYALLGSISGGQGFLAPYDYIYAAIIARTIAPHVTKFLDVTRDEDKQQLIGLMNEYKDAIQNIYNRSNLLAQDIQIANRDIPLQKRMETLFKKVMELINKLNETRFSLQVDQQEAKTMQLFNDYKNELIRLISSINDPHDADIETLYLEIKKSYALYQSALRALQSHGITSQNRVLEPYDQIYAAIVASVIKPQLGTRILEKNQDDLQMIFDKMRRDSKDKEAINAIISKSKSLNEDINNANAKQDGQRDVALVMATVDLLNDLELNTLTAEKVGNAEDDLLEETLQETIGE